MKKNVKNILKKGLFYDLINNQKEILQSEENILVALFNKFLNKADGEIFKTVEIKDDNSFEEIYTFQVNSILNTFELFKKRTIFHFDNGLIHKEIIFYT